MKPFMLVPAILAIAVAACRSSPRSGAPADSSAAAQTGASGEIALQGDFHGPLGVQLYSVRNETQKDLPGTLARVHALGFVNVELAGTYGLSAAQFRRLLDSTGLRAVSMHVGYEQFRDSLDAVLRDAKTLGVEFLGTAWIPHPDGPISEEGAHQAAADFNRWGRAAKQQGLHFFYHMHGFEFTPGKTGALPMDILMRETDPDAVEYEMDVFWIARPGADPAAWLRKYPARWRLMHLKDMKQGTATNVNTGSANPDSAEVPVGTGQIDYRAVLRAAQDIGVQQYFLEDETSAPFTTMPQSVRWLETVRF